MAIDILLADIEGSEPPAPVVLEVPELVVRASTAAPPTRLRRDFRVVGLTREGFAGITSHPFWDRSQFADTSTVRRRRGRRCRHGIRACAGRVAPRRCRSRRVGRPFRARSDSRAHGARTASPLERNHSEVQEDRGRHRRPRRRRHARRMLRRRPPGLRLQWQHRQQGRPRRRRDADQGVRPLDRRRQRRQVRPREGRLQGRPRVREQRHPHPGAADQHDDHQGRQGPDHRLDRRRIAQRPAGCRGQGRHQGDLVRPPADR